MPSLPATSATASEAPVTGSGVPAPVAIPGVGAQAVGVVLAIINASRRAGVECVDPLCLMHGPDRTTGLQGGEGGIDKREACEGRGQASWCFAICSLEAAKGEVSRAFVWLVCPNAGVGGMPASTQWLHAGCTTWARPA